MAMANNEMHNKSKHFFARWNAFLLDAVRAYVTYQLIVSWSTDAEEKVFELHRDHA